MKSILLSSPDIGPITDKLMDQYGHDPVSALIDDIVTHRMMDVGCVASIALLEEQCMHGHFGNQWEAVTESICDLFSTAVLNEQFNDNVTDAAMWGSDVNIYVEVIDDNSAMVTFISE